MILCSCNLLTKADLLEAADSLVAAERTHPVTAGRIFQSLGARPQCGSCIHLIRAMLRDYGMPMTCPEPIASVAAEEDAPTLDMAEIEEPV